MTAAPQLRTAAFVADTADTADTADFVTRLKSVTLSNGNSVVIDATRRARRPGRTLRARQFDSLGRPLGEEVTFLFAAAWDIATPEFDIAVLDNDRIVIVGQNPVDVLTIRDFEAPQQGLETFRRKTLVNAALLPAEDCASPIIPGLDGGGERVDWASTQAAEDLPGMERRERSDGGHAAAEVAFSRYNGALHAEPGPRRTTDGSRVVTLDRYGAGSSDGPVPPRIPFLSPRKNQPDWKQR
ncbi:hypothetical protein [Pelagibius sp.]|uniref:hypothetical protein n=1 Tax=Pelagibius sp. TaxID=1931238 RepID=UPI003B510047